MRFLKTTGLALASALVLAACQDSAAPTGADLALNGGEAQVAMKGRADLPSIAELAQGTTLEVALDAAMIKDVFDGKRHYTVFAPTDAAFDATFDFLQNSCGITPGDLLANKDLLTQILLFHVARGDRTSTALLASGQVRMLDGNRATIENGMIEGATLGPVDIRARNGIVHFIDGVLIPPAVADILADICS